MMMIIIIIIIIYDNYFPSFTYLAQFAYIVFEKSLVENGQCAWFVTSK